MNYTTRRGARRKWRLLFAAIALFTLLSGTLASPGAVRVWAADHVVEVADPLQGQNPSLAQADSQSAPAPGPATPSKGRFRYFADTGHFLKGVFLTYWERHGQLPVLGLPLTEPIVENGLTVQYLERARLEWHPDNADPGQQVQLARLGAILTEQRGVFFNRLAGGADTPQSRFFNETGHNLANAFLSYWQRNGGLDVFGYPISEEIVETSPTDGQQYTVQYFERNRFEWHPEHSPAYNVQLGLLGSEYAHIEGLNPIARVMLPATITNDADLTNSAALNDLVDPGAMPALQLLGQTPQFKWVPAIVVQNKIYIEFQDVGEEGVAGAFVATYSKTRPYVIIIPTSQRNASAEALASVLAHEATHAQDVIGGVAQARANCSVEEEFRAYLNGLASWIILKGSDALSQRYPSGSLEAAINRSLRGFNDNRTQLSLDFDVAAAHAFLADLYGPDCGR